MIARDGYPYLVVGGAAVFAAFVLGWHVLTSAFAVLTLFFAYFFRDPERVIPNDPLAIVSPADGRIVRVGPVDPALADSPQVISIFLSPLDVHVNRSPIAGRISDFSYHPGRFMVALRDEASLLNEQTHITVEGERCQVVFKQIAGILARRIVFRKSIGDQVGKGERVGMIKFGSRTDVVLPAGAIPSVSRGDRVYGGSSIVARIS